METVARAVISSRPDSNRTVSGWKRLPETGNPPLPHSNRTVSGWKPRCGTPSGEGRIQIEPYRDGNGGCGRHLRPGEFKSNRIGMETAGCPCAPSRPDSNRTVSGWKLCVNVTKKGGAHSNRTVSGWKRSLRSSFHAAIDSNRTVSGWKLWESIHRWISSHSNRTVSGWKPVNPELKRLGRFKSNRIGMETIATTGMPCLFVFKSNRIGMETSEQPESRGG